MKKLNLYIGRQIVVGFLLVTFTLMSIIWLTQSLRFVELITNKGISVGVFVKLTSLVMPRIFAVLASIALFAAVLFVYNRLLSDRELVVMKAAGVTPWQNAKPALSVGIFMAFFCFYVMNWGIPAAEKEFDELQWQVKNDVSHLMFRAGEFTSLQNNLTVFIAKHEADGSISGILVNDERNPKVKTTLSAEMGRVVYTNEGPKIIMVNGVRQEINKQNMQFSSLAFERYSVDFGMTNNSQRKAAGVRQQSLGDLLGALDNPNLNDKDKKKYFVEGNKRIISPLMNVLFALMACTGLLVGNFNRRGQMKIISVSIVCMIVVLGLDLAITNVAAKHLYMLSVLYLNLLAPLLICFYLLWFYNPAYWTKRKKPLV